MVYVFFLVVVDVVFFFFFSSRRRHTRSDRDWSSDVCSSDLPPTGASPRCARGRAIPPPAASISAPPRNSLVVHHPGIVLPVDRARRPGCADACVASCARSVTHLRDALPRVLVGSLAPAAD